MKKVKIIAEIGNSHEGSVGLAKQFIATAAACGADSVKFQTHIFEAESLPDAPNPPYFKDESRKAYFERTAFTFTEYQQLKKFAEVECRVEFLSSPFSIPAAQMLLDLSIETLKIPSGEVNNLPLLEFINAKKCKVLLSSGMSSWAEMDKAVETLKDCELTLLQCTSAYPCPPEKAGLNLLKEFMKRYGKPVGFSDHTVGPAIALAAVTLGASVVEKHFTLSKHMYGSDAWNAMEPGDFTKLCTSIREVEAAMNSVTDKDIAVAGLSQMKYTFEKSIVSARAIAAGKRIEYEDLDFKKPGNGIPAMEYRQLIGMTAVQDIPANTLISREQLSK